MRRHHPRPPMSHPGMGPQSIGLMRPPIPMGPPEFGVGPMPGMGMPPIPMGPQLSSSTNSNDPTSKDSRLFVGNLNTIALSKEDIQNIFGIYGVVVGISMHKGYAFVQYNHPDEARRAGVCEDGKTYAGQAIDINIVSQPKNRNLKRAGSRSDSSQQSKKSRGDTKPLMSLGIGSKKTYSNNAIKRAIATATKRESSKKFNQVNDDGDSSECWSDVPCKMQFSDIQETADNKKICTLRLSVTLEDEDLVDSGEPDSIWCANCDAEFVSAWQLCQHYEEEHKMRVYKIKEEKTANGNGSSDEVCIPTQGYWGSEKEMLKEDTE